MCRSGLLEQHELVNNPYNLYYVYLYVDLAYLNNKN